MKGNLDSVSSVFFLFILYLIPLNLRIIPLIHYFEIFFLSFLFLQLGRGVIFNSVRIHFIFPLLTFVFFSLFFSNLINSLISGFPLSFYIFKQIKYLLVYLGAFLFGTRLDIAAFRNSWIEWVLRILFVFSFVCISFPDFGMEMASIFLPQGGLWTDGQGNTRVMDEPSDLLMTEDGRMRLFDNNPSVVSICMLVFIFPATFSAFNSSRNRLIRCFLAILCGGGIILFTKSIMGAASFGLFLLVNLYHGKSWGFNSPRFFVGAVLVGGISSVAFLYQMIDYFSRYSADYVWFAFSKRVEIYLSSFQVFLDSPIIGLGINSANWGRFHSQIFGALGQGGIIGLVTLLGLNLWILREARRCFRNSKRVNDIYQERFALFVFSALLCFALIQIFDEPLFISSYCSFNFVLVGTIAQSRRRLKTKH
jgi:hypothetical protein